MNLSASQESRSRAKARPEGRAVNSVEGTHNGRQTEELEMG